jgi:hypothetical protein
VRSKKEEVRATHHLSPLTSHLSRLPPPFRLLPSAFCLLTSLLTFVFDHLQPVVYIRHLNDQSSTPLTIGLTLLAQAAGAKYPKAK